MTQEQKAKAYDEAIRKIKGMMPNWERLSYNGKTFIQDLIHIFPELAESEDEKIRKMIINQMERWHKAALENNAVQDIKDSADAITWLEKQGQKLNPIIDIEIPFGAKDSELQEATYLIPEGFHAEIKGNEVHIKKGKQKPAWSKEDEEIIHNIRMLIEKYAISQSAVDVNGELCDKICMDADNWLKSLKERYTWKPSEELDEASYQVGVKRVLENPESYGLTKYNWKPSDEQMHMLRRMITALPPGEVHNGLESLYNDLKKTNKGISYGHYNIKRNY